MSDPATHYQPSACPRCKICGAETRFFDRVDLHNNAKMHFGYYDREILPSGLMLDYFRCHACGFLFTNHMDDWTPAHFAQFIYNKDYPQIDGTYNGYRAGTFANIITLAFYEHLKRLDFLDYGGGLGIQAALLRSFGAHRSETYDPFAIGRIRPEGQFNIVTCMETLEHSTDPRQTVADLVSFAEPNNGLIFFTTEAPPADIEEQKGAWWYINPRVGHVSFYSFDAMARLFAPHGYRLTHVETHAHVAYRTWPAWAKNFLPPQYLPEDAQP